MLQTPARQETFLYVLVLSPCLTHCEISHTRVLYTCIYTWQVPVRSKYKVVFASSLMSFDGISAVFPLTSSRCYKHNSLLELFVFCCCCRVIYKFGSAKHRGQHREGFWFLYQGKQGSSSHCFVCLLAYKEINKEKTTKNHIIYLPGQLPHRSLLKSIPSVH